MTLTTNYRDDEGNETDLSADSVEALAAQLPEDYSGPRLTVRDEADSIRGWIGGRADWTAQ
jgi:hypothetical protein